MENENIVEHNTMINDIREPNEFKGISFSGYKKTDVKKQLVNNISKSKIEPACYWCAELISAGHYMELWETIIYYVGKYIHIGNTKLVIYLERRYEVFKNIMQQGYYINELQLRNNKTIRTLFAEIIFVLSKSPKKHSFESIKINKIEEFDITQMPDRLKAINMKYVEFFFTKEDPKELYIAMNEFAFHISNESKNMLLACYWIEWLIEFDLICKKRKEPCICKRRNYPVENKLQKDIIWMIWDILIEASKNKNEYVEKIMNSILKLFCIKYTTASCKKRRYLLYYAVALLTEHFEVQTVMFENKELLSGILDNIGLIYKQIKKSEVSPNTDYLFHNIDNEKNFENSVKKIEMINQMDFIPRI
jgi:hypothetical protein